MAYHLYHTEGFVVGERAYGEANKIFFVLTPDLGLIAVIAQGIRNIHSKLKFHLDKFGHLKLVVVRGRELWRLTNAEKIYDLENVYGHELKLKQAAKIFSVLNHLIRGEEKSEELFGELKKSLQFLDQMAINGDGRERLANWEHITLLRLFGPLGYLKEDPELLQFTEPSAWNEDMVGKMTRVERAKAAKLINLSLKHSHI